MLPHIPVIANPSPQQVQAARHAVARTVRAHAERTGKSGGAAVADLRGDARARDFVAAADYYSKVGKAQQVQQIGEALGGRDRKERERMGRQFLAYQGQRDQVHEGKPLPKVSALGVNVPLGAIAKGAKQAVAGATSLDQGDIGPRQAFSRTAKDIASLGTTPVILGYETGAGLADVVRGKGTGRLERTGKAVLGSLEEQVTHPLKFAGEHPGLAALTLAGGIGAAGRVGGALARGAGSRATETGMRGALARVGSTERAPLALGSDVRAPLAERAGKRGLAGKARQSFGDIGRKPLVDAEGNEITRRLPSGRVEPILQARERSLIPGVKPERERLQRREANFRASRASAEERLVRDQLHKEYATRGIKGHTARELVTLAVEGGILTGKTFEDDLRRIGSRLTAELRTENGRPGSVYRHPGEKATAQRQLQVVQKALSSPKVLAQGDRIATAGAEIGRKLNALENEAIRLNVLSPVRAGRSRLVVPAIEHLGARHFTPEETRLLLEEGAAARRTGREEAGQLALSGDDAALSGMREQLRVMAKDDPRRGDLEARIASSQLELEDLRRASGRGRAVVPDMEYRAMEALADAQDALDNHLQRIHNTRTREASPEGAGPAGGLLRERAGELDAEARALRAKRDAALKAWRAERRQEPTESVFPAADVTEAALEHGALRASDGRFLSNKDIEEAIAAKGRDPSTVAYLPHRLDVRGRRAFHARFQPGSRPLIDKAGQVRTGAAYVKGAISTDPERVLEQASRLAVQTIRTGHTDRLIGELGLRKPNGQHFAKKEGDEFAQRLAESTGERYVWVSAHPAKLSEGARIAVRREQGSEAMTTLQRALLNQRIHPGAGADNGVMVPAPVIDQLMNHLRPAGQIEKFFQAVNPFFRMAVLPQFRWLTGNFVEPWFIRLPVEGTGPINIPGMALDLVATKRILRTMERSDNPRVRAAAQHLRAQQVGSGLFIGGRGNTVRRELRELGSAGEAAAFFRDLPVMKQAADLYTAIPKGFFAINRTLIEAPAQKVAFGRLARREIQSFTGSWIKTVTLQRAAMEELAKGLTNTATQHRFMREQHRMLGQYEGFNPGLRRLVQSVTPFVPWYLNALRFAYWTMPVDHPTITALALQTGNTFEKDWDEMHRNVPPGSLRMAIPDGKGGWLDLARYTPYGAGEEIQGGAASWQSILNQIAPQFQGIASALTGEDPFGRPLQFPKTPSHPEGKATNALELIKVAGNQALGSTVWGWSLAQRLREGGRTPYAGSTPISPSTKPGTETPPRQVGPVTIPSAVERTFDPFRPTRLRASAEPQVSTPPAAAGPQTPLERFQQRRAAAAARNQGQVDALARFQERRAAAARRRSP